MMHKPSIKNNNFSWDFPSCKMEPDVTTDAKLRRTGLYSLRMHLVTPNTWHDDAVLRVYLPPQVAANEVTQRQETQFSGITPSNLKKH